MLSIYLLSISMLLWPSDPVSLIYLYINKFITTWTFVLYGRIQSLEFWLGFPFAKLLRNFSGTKRKIFLSLRNHFAQNCPFPLLRNSSVFPIPQLEFCAIPQFRKNQTVGDGVCFLEFNSGKIFGISSYWSLLHNWPMTVQISQFSQQF